MSEDRKTFTIPNGHEAVLDSEGRATGEVRPITTKSAPPMQPSQQAEMLPNREAAAAGADTRSSAGSARLTDDLEVAIQRALLDDEYFGTRAEDQDDLELMARGSAVILADAIRPLINAAQAPIYQVMATDDDEGAGKDVWMDVTKDVFDDLKQRNDVRYRILAAAQPPAAPVSVCSAHQQPEEGCAACGTTPAPADPVESPKDMQTCHDCGDRDPCDEDCPNHIGPADPVETDKQIKACMDALEDVPGETLPDRVNRLLDWYQALSNNYHKDIAEAGDCSSAGAVDRETAARAIRLALTEEWTDADNCRRWDEDVLLTGCRKVGGGSGYSNPEQAAQKLALMAADAVLALYAAEPHGFPDTPDLGTRYSTVSDNGVVVGLDNEESAASGDAILRKFADAFRSGAQGATMDCDDAQKMALAIDGLLGGPQGVSK